MDPTWISAGALAIAALSLFYSRKKDDAVDTDKRIDERIELAVGAQLAVIHEQLGSIQATLAASAQNNAALVRVSVESTATAIGDAAKAMLRIRDWPRGPEVRQ